MDDIELVIYKQVVPNSEFIDFDDGLSVSITEFQELVEIMRSKVPDEFKDSLSFEISQPHEDGSFESCFFYLEPESDEHLAERVADEKERVARIEEKELRELKRLQEKYS